MSTTRYDDFTRPMNPQLVVDKINAAFGGIDPHDHAGAGRGGTIPGSAISGAVAEATYLQTTTITDANLATKAGDYALASGATNVPDSAAAWFLKAYGDFVSNGLQMANKAGTLETWKRKYSSGTWGSWVKAMDFTFAYDAPYYNAQRLERNSTLHYSEIDWKTVGPTGSGADMIWTELDGIPNGIKGLRLNLYLGMNTSSTNTVHVLCKIRKNGSSVNPIACCELIRVPLSGEGYTMTDHNTIDVLVDSNKMFQILTNASGFGNWQLLVYLEGYYN